MALGNTGSPKEDRRAASSASETSRSRIRRSTSIVIVSPFVISEIGRPTADSGGTSATVNPLLQRPDNWPSVMKATSLCKFTESSANTTCGYWQADLEALDHPGDTDRGELLVDYLDLSEKHLVSAGKKLAADGKYELAASLLEASAARFGHTEFIVKAERLVYLKLMEKYQNTDPFKYILYSAKIGEQTRALAASK